MPQQQGNQARGGIWIVEDDREVAQALLAYLRDHIAGLDQHPSSILPGPEVVQQSVTPTGTDPSVVIVGTEHPNQTTLDVVHALEQCAPAAHPLVIALGVPRSDAPERVCWELWPAAEEPALAARVRQKLFGGPQSNQSDEGVS